MSKPKMILFDYGQTLVPEKRFDGIAAITVFAMLTEQRQWDYSRFGIE